MKIIKAALLCVILSLTLLFAISAATPREMYENGAVSDGSVRFGDMRDGVVSDVSEDSEIFNGEGTGLMEDIIGGSEKVTTDKTTIPTPMESGVATDNTGTDTTGNASDDAGSKTMGIIIAVAVVIAVIVIIFLLLPKRRG